MAGTDAPTHESRSPRALVKNAPVLIVLLALLGMALAAVVSGKDVYMAHGRASSLGLVVMFGAAIAAVVSHRPGDVVARPLHIALFLGGLVWALVVGVMVA